MACLASLTLALPGCQFFYPSPPDQQAFGPGGADYKHAGVTIERHLDDGEEYWLFLPADPVPEEAPVVIFMHGWAGTSPQPYSAWIRHLVRKGHILIYPRYQENIFTDFEEMEPNARFAIAEAWKRLIVSGETSPRRDSIAWVGHSLGGILAANLAANPGDLPVPPAAVLMVVQAGGLERIRLADVTGLPAESLVLVVHGESDWWVGREPSAQIAAALEPVVPADNFSFVTIPTDRRSFPALVAHHLAPLAEDKGFSAEIGEVADGASRTVSLPDIEGEPPAAGEGPDALDYYGYWKLLDGLLDAAFRGTHRDFALGGESAQRYMGVHSNGQPVTRIIVNDSTR